MALDLGPQFSDVVLQSLCSLGYSTKELVGAAMFSDDELESWARELNLPLELYDDLLNIWKFCRGAPAARADHLSRAAAVDEALCCTSAQHSDVAAGSLLVGCGPYLRGSVSVCLRSRPARSSLAPKLLLTGTL